MKTILHVPFAEKEEAKALGAWWSPDMRTWYVPNECETPLEKFDRWAKAKPKERVDTLPPVRTGKLKEGCACEVLPWEDCIHTRT